MTARRARAGRSWVARQRRGYVFLVSVLAIGTIVAATTVSLLLLGGAAERTAASLAHSVQALENARTCVERGLASLRADPTYAGEETFVLEAGACALQPVGGAGNGPRTICATGEDRGSVRRLEVRVTTLLPRVTVKDWREVSSFSFCP